MGPPSGGAHFLDADLAQSVVDIHVYDLEDSLVDTSLE